MAGTATALAVGTAATSSAAATAGLVGAAGSVSALGLFSLATTGLGIASSIAGMNAQKGQARQAAYDETLATKAGRLRGEQEQNRIKKSLLRDISTATARAGKAGTGSALLSQQGAGIESDAANELEVSRFNTALEGRRRKAQAAVYRRAGRSSILDYIGPVGEGATQLATHAIYR